MNTPTKRCTSCGKEFPATTEYFYAHKLGRFGLFAECKLCYSNRGKQYRKKNRDKIRARMKQYCKSTSDRGRERSRRHYEANKDKILERSRHRYEADRTKAFAQVRNRRALKRAAEGTHTATDVRAQYKRQKGCCYYCGCELNGKYHVDHVIPLSRGGSNGPDNIVCACQSCNLSKSNKLPHEWPDGGRLL